MFVTDRGISRTTKNKIIGHTQNSWEFVICLAVDISRCRSKYPVTCFESWQFATLGTPAANARYQRWRWLGSAVSARRCWWSAASEGHGHPLHTLPNLVYQSILQIESPCTPCMWLMFVWSIHLPTVRVFLNPEKWSEQMLAVCRTFYFLPSWFANFSDFPRLVKPVCVVRCH